MSLTTLVAAGAEKTQQLPFPAPVFGIIALGGFVVLLGVTWAFRNTAKKHHH